MKVRVTIVRASGVLVLTGIFVSFNNYSTSYFIHFRGQPWCFGWKPLHFNDNQTILHNTTIMIASPSNTSSLNDLIDIEMQFLSRLMVTIESQQWEVLGNAILNNPEVFRTFARSLANSPTHHLNGMTM